MRIAVIGSKGIPAPGGVEVAVEEVCSRLAELGHSITVFSSPRLSGSVTDFRGCRVHPSGPGLKGRLDMPARTVSAMRYVRAHSDQFDVVHIHSVDPFLMARGLVGHLPVAVTSHGQAWRLREAGLFQRLMSRLAEKAFLASTVPASAVSARLSAWYTGRRGLPVEHIPNGARLLPRGDRSSLPGLGLSEGSYVLFVAGRLIPSKGLETLFQAWKLLRPPLSLALVVPDGGSSAFARRLRREAPEGTVWCGLLGGNDLGDVLGATRFAVFPSLIEAQSLTLLELLANCPRVLYSDIAENLEAAVGLGITFLAGDPEALAAAMDEALRRTAEPPAAARAAFLEAHDWNRIAETYLSFLERAARFVPAGRAGV